MINAQLWSRTKQLAILENEIETKSHIETINGAFGKTIYDIAKGIGATPAFEQLNSRGIEVLLNTPWQGANYSKRIWGNSSPPSRTAPTDSYQGDNDWNERRARSV